MALLLSKATRKFEKTQERALRILYGDYESDYTMRLLINQENP